MYKLYTDKQEIFECDIQLEGASLTNSKARLVIETTDLALLFKGTINSEGKCRIPVKRLKGILGENSKGTIKLEVIAEDTYFTPWESDFEVETSKKITVEVKSQTFKKPIVEAKVKITNSEQKHVINLLKLLIKENINIKNISYKRNKLNNIVATYLKENTIKNTEDVVSGVLKRLQKEN